MIKQILFLVTILASSAFAALDCCDLCDIRVSPDPCGTSAQWGQMSCALGQGFCQSATCDDCTPALLKCCDSCTSNGQCSGSLACVNGKCSDATCNCGAPSPTRTTTTTTTTTKKVTTTTAPPSSAKQLIGYWNEQYGEPLATICKQGYNVVNVYNLAHFGYESDFPEQPNGVITSSITDIAACRALGVKVVLVLGGANGAKYAVDGYPSGYSIKNGASLAKSLWTAYFSKNQFDGVDFDIEGLYNNHGTGSDLAAMITYFRQQGGSNFIISLAPYSNYDGTEDAQAVVRDGISRAKTSISYLNVQTYRVYYSGVEDNGLIQANYNWYAAQYGIPINIGINVCVDYAIAKISHMKTFAKTLNPPPAGLFIWSADCASLNQKNGVSGLRVSEFNNWVHGTFPN